MKLVVFCYDFPHWKTWQGLLIIQALRASKCLVLGAPRIETETSGTLRTWARRVPTPNTRDLAHDLNLPFFGVAHDSPKCLELIHAFRPKLGVILGAMILSRRIVNEAGCPIMNIHPGVLPANRGLDCVAWAPRLGLPQGVSVHIIRPRVDSGPILHLKILANMSEGEAPVETRARLDHLQLRCLFDALYSTSRRGDLEPGLVLPPGPYHSRYDSGEVQLRTEYASYVRSYHTVLKDWATTAPQKLLEVVDYV